MENAVAYCRFSSDNQREESIDAQLRAIEKFAQDKGYNIVKVYADKAKSGRTAKREEFQKMIKDSELGIFQYVVVHKLDRFTRNRFDSAIYKRELKSNGVQVLSVTENIDGSPESTILEALLEGIAQYYSENLAREVKKGMMENAYNAKHCGGTPPLGYDVDPTTKKYIINEDEKVIVKEIFQKYSDGWGYTRLIKYLNECGYKTKRGNNFGKNSLLGILKNEKYTGTYVFNRAPYKLPNGKRNHHKKHNEEDIIRIEGGMPSIISKELFEKVRIKIQENKKEAGKYTARENYLLSGIIKCGYCGGSYQGNSRIGGRNKKRYVSYRCGTRNRKQTCDNREVTKKYIERYVFDALRKQFFTPNAIQRLIEKLQDYQKQYSIIKEEKIQDLNDRIEDIDKKIDNLIDVISSGLGMASIKERLEKLEDEKLEIQIQLKELEIRKQKSEVIDKLKIKEVLQKHRKHVEEMDIIECKKFIRNYIQSIVVYHDYVEIQFTLGMIGLGEESFFKTDISIHDLYEEYSVEAS